MVNIPKLRSRMALMGFNQKRLVARINASGVKISENTFSAKMNGTSSFDCDLVDVICDILEVFFELAYSYLVRHLSYFPFLTEEVKVDDFFV